MSKVGRINDSQLESSRRLDSEDLIWTTKEILGHLYSANTAYQNRILSAYYHPHEVMYSDPLVKIYNREALRRLFMFYFSWFTESVELNIKHVTLTPATTIRYRGTRQAGATIIMVDHAIKIRQYNSLGKVFSLLRILPPITFLAGTKTGLRIVSKLTWLDNVRNEHMQRFSGSEAKGFIIQHEDLYSGNFGGSFLFYPLFWLLFFFQLLLSIFAPVTRVFERLLNTHPIVTSSSASNSGNLSLESTKKPVGWLITDVFLGQVERAKKSYRR